MSPSRSAAAPPLSVIRAAVKVCRRRFARRRDILGVGVGLKHRRRDAENHGYGAVPIPCVKFVVARKRDRASLSRPIPRWVLVRRGRRTYRVQTDVEQVDGMGEHAPAPELRVSAPSHPRGTPGVFVRDEGGALYLLTAGHVLVRDFAGPPLPNAGATINGAPVGRVVAHASYFKSLVSAGDSEVLALVDVGLIEVTEPLPAAVRTTPWNQAIVPVRAGALEDALARGEQVRFTYHGLTNSGRAMLDMVASDGPSVITKPTKADGKKLFAPVILHSRAIPDGPDAQPGRFDAGDSGAPLVTDDGKWIGLHVVGLSGGGRESWAVLGESALSHVGARFGSKLTPSPV